MDCESLQEYLARVTHEKRELQDELDIYKPVLLALVVVLACTGVWLLALALTGKRREKIRVFLRREQMVTQIKPVLPGKEGSNLGYEEDQVDERVPAVEVTAPIIPTIQLSRPSICSAQSYTASAQSDSNSDQDLEIASQTDQ